METSDLLINALLFLFLPLWGIAGFVDWCCHRASHIEQTSGLKESIMHSVMGVQMAIPIALCLIFEVNVLILIICFITWLCHEFVAHWDVHYASPRREISIWEMHAHTYLGSLPTYMLATIVIINWQQFENLLTLNWQDNVALKLIDAPHGGDKFIPIYLSFMAVACVFPYIEENIRCLRVHFKKEG